MHWLQFIAYFLCALLFFGLISMALGKAFDMIDEKRARKFEEKVNRYRRGTR